MLSVALALFLTGTADWSTTFSAQHVPTWVPPRCQRVVVAPAGDDDDTAAAARALTVALKNSRCRAVLPMSGSATESDSALAIRAQAMADLAAVVRVFPNGAQRPPVAVVSFVDGVGHVLSTFQAVKGVEVKTKDGAAPVAVRERRAVASAAPSAPEPAATPVAQRHDVDDDKSSQGGVVGGTVVSSTAEAASKPSVVSGVEVTITPVSGSLAVGPGAGQLGTQVSGSIVMGAFSFGLVGRVAWADLENAALQANRLVVDPMRLGWMALAFFELRPTWTISPYVRLAVGLGQHHYTLLDGLTYAGDPQAVGMATVGLRWQVSKRFGLSLAFDNVVTTDAPGALEGCSLGSVSNFDAALRAGRPLSSLGKPPECSVTQFERQPANVPYALALLHRPSSPVWMPAIGLTAHIDF